MGRLGLRIHDCLTSGNRPAFASPSVPEQLRRARPNGFIRVLEQRFAMLLREPVPLRGIRFSASRRAAARAVVRIKPAMAKPRLPAVNSGSDFTSRRGRAGILHVHEPADRSLLKFRVRGFAQILRQPRLGAQPSRRAPRCEVHHSACRSEPSRCRPSRATASASRPSVVRAPGCRERVPQSARGAISLPG